MLKKKNPGISLVETLVSMALLGVIFIPLLFVSSAVFLGQLVQMREQVDVSHGSSRFLSGFMRDLQHARRVLPQSDADNLYLAYFDPVRQREMTVHYQIAASDHLRKFIQNTMTGNWDEVSPYGTLEAGEIDLTSGGTLEFAYCLDEDCSGSTDVSAEPERAVLVQLKDWVFTQGDQSLALPELNVYVSTDSQAGSTFTLSDEVRELYSFDATVPFGGNLNYRMIHLTPTGHMFNYLDYTTPTGPGILTTIVTGDTKMGYGSTVIAENTGRVFWGEDQWNSGSLRTYTESDGLSVIVSDQGIGYFSIAVSSNGRVYSGYNSGKIYTWHEDTGLSTVISGVTQVGIRNIYVTHDDRVYFGDDDTPDGDDSFWTWHPDTGLSTIIDQAGYSPGRKSGAVDPITGRVFFGEEVNSSGDFWTWHKDTGLSTLVSGANEPGVLNTFIRSDGRVYFGEKNNPSRLWTWKDNVLTTIVTLAMNMDDPGRGGMVFGSDGKVYFGEMAFWGNLYAWQEGEGLTTIAVDEVDNGLNYGGFITADDRLFYASGKDPGNYRTWHKDTGLSVIVSGLSRPGQTSSYEANWLFRGNMLAPDGRIFFGEHDNPGNFYTWHIDTGLTTILTGKPYPGVGLSGGVLNDGRVFIGTSEDPGGFWTWHKDTGLTTIISDGKGAGAVTLVTDKKKGIVYFGEYAGNIFRAWKIGVPTTDIKRASATGSKTNQALAIASGSNSYIAATQAVEGDFYLVNTEGDKLDRYTYNTVAKRFERKSQLPLGSWAANVGAVVTDQANDDVALLDTVGQKIYVYGDRTATSGSPTVYDSGNGFDFAVSPTGLAINQRTGDYLVIDSDVNGSAGNERINLYLVDLDADGPTATLKKIFRIPIGTGQDNFSNPAGLASETNFKIQYDEAKNILYLMAPSTNKVYALMLPEYI